jgi:hypothetical protein
MDGSTSHCIPHNSFERRSTTSGTGLPHYARGCHTHRSLDRPSSHLPGYKTRRASTSQATEVSIERGVGRLRTRVQPTVRTGKQSSHNQQRSVATILHTRASPQHPDQTHSSTARQSRSGTNGDLFVVGKKDLQEQKPEPMDTMVGQSTGRCNWCNFPGHFERECRIKAKGLPKKDYT